MLKSANLGLNIFEGSDNVKRESFVENFEILDNMYGPVIEQASETVYATGTNNTFIVTSDEPLKSYYKSLKRIVFFDKDWNGTGTINFDGLGAKYIKDCYGTTQNNLKAGIPYHICYNGSDFILLGKGGGGNAQPIQVLENYTFTNDSGPHKGTMKNNGAKIYTPGRNNIAITEGYHNGQGYIKGEPNLIPENLVAGAEYFGVKGTATPVENLTIVSDATKQSNTSNCTWKVCLKYKKYCTFYNKLTSTGSYRNQTGRGYLCSVLNGTTYSSETVSIDSSNSDYNILIYEWYSTNSFEFTYITDYGTNALEIYFTNGETGWSGKVYG